MSEMKRIVQIFILFFLVINSGVCQEIEHQHSIHHSFIENKGQWDKDILFQSKFSGGNLWIQQNRFLFHFQDRSLMQRAHMGGMKGNEGHMRQAFVSVDFEGSNKVQNITKEMPTPNYYNYFLGNNPKKWASDVHGYGEATMDNFYNSIDLKLIENKNELKYEFHAKAGSDPSVITLVYKGQNKIFIDGSGSLIVETELGQFIEKKPYCYQIINGKILEVDGNFRLENNKVRFSFGKYNKSYELVIDPTLIFATYSGSVTDNFGMTATYAYDGKAYTGGTIYGNQYPAPDPNAFDVTSTFSTANAPSPQTLAAAYGVSDVFISKYSEDGQQMLWTTFVGGGDSIQGTETVHSLIADEFDNLYLFGATSSTDFPIVNGYQTLHAGGTPFFDFYYNGVFFKTQGSDIYIAKLSSNGHNLLASTYIGGSGNDGVNTVDRTMTYLDAASGTFHFNSNGIIYDSITPNYGDQFRGEIMLDQNNNVLVASCTRSVDFPVLNAFQNTNAGKQDGVVFKLNNSLSTLISSSYFGGSQSDACYSVKIDSTDHIVFCGGTISNNLPVTPGIVQGTYGGGKTDGFVAKMNVAGTALQAVTYIGTNQADQAFFVDINRNDEIFLFGQSQGGTFPISNANFFNNNSNQFVCKLDPNLTTYLNSTKFGNGSNSALASPSAFLVDVCGNMYMSCWGGHIITGPQMNGMPVTPDALYPTSPNGYDFYLIVIDRTFDHMIYGTYLGGNQAMEHVDGGTSRFDKHGVVYQSVCGGCGSFGAGYSDFATTPNAWSSTNDCTTGCNNLIFKFDFGIIPHANFNVGDNLGCTDFQVHFTNTSTASDTYLWDFGNGDTSSIIFNPNIVYDSAGVYNVYLYVTDSICQLTDTAHIVITVTDSTKLSVSADIDICTPVPLNLEANSYGTATSFVWSSNINFTDTLNTNILDSTLNITPQGSTTYYVMVDNAGGCSKIDSVQVHFTSSDLILSGNDSICRGDTSLITALNINPSINFQYAWTPSSVIVTPSVSNTVLVDPDTTQYIYVTASASNGCIIHDSMLIAVSYINSANVIATASDTYVPDGDTVMLNGQPNGYTYLWTPSTGVQDPNAQHTQAIVSHTTLYTLQVSDGICMRSDTVLVKTFEFSCEKPFVFIPDAFSPNGDNINDILYVRGKIIKEMDFKIFDRWGEMVFESFDRAHGWDGTFRGKKLDPDVYDYWLKVTCLDGVEKLIKGNITLLK